MEHSNRSVRIIGYSGGKTGYADTTNQLVLAFDKLGYNVCLKPFDTPDSKVTKFAENHTYDDMPEIWNDIPAHKDSKDQYIYTVFELDTIPVEWRYYLYHSKEVWLPTKFVAKMFGKSFPEILDKIHIIPHGVNSYFSPNGIKLNFENIHQKFKFLTMAHLTRWDGRKNVKMVIEAFCDEFHKDESVALVLKCSLYGSGCIDLEVKKIVDEYENPNVYLFREMLPHERLQYLYRGCDCFVTANRGEGFGKPLLEAMASGMIVIGPNHGGSLEFMNKNNSLLVDVGDWEEIGPYPYRWYYPDMKWKTPIIGSLKEKMRAAFMKRPMKFLRNNAVVTAKKFTWERTVKMMLERIENG